MPRVLDQSVPCFRFFEDLCEIPHGSGKEKALSDFLVAFAKKKKLWVNQDALGNVFVKKPASAGYEAAAPLLLQSHIDMVCEKNEDVDHDFLVDPLHLYIEDGWLKARGTTLGADDGCGVATMLAILDDDKLAHPALECVFTVEEETGMQGAAALDYSLLTARRMIGLDAAGETTTVASSAGGLRVRAHKKLARETYSGVGISLFVFGLQGGHSGIFINKERGNSIKIAGRVLYRVKREGIPFRLVDIHGGSKDNAIPRECTVVLACAGSDLARILAIVDVVREEVTRELAVSDDGFALTVTTQSTQEWQVIPGKQTSEMIDLLALLPNGVAAMSMSIPDLVQTSDNVGVISIEGAELVVLISLRSEIESRIEELCDRIVRLCQIFNTEYEIGSRYPGMEFQAASPFREHFASVMQELWGQELRVRTGHVGGEGGYFARHLPGIQIVTIGPFIQDVHCPDETMNVASFHKVYDFLVQFLARLTT
ncbi:aminoacyl-histidine dipeptidase [Clostridia bacterium]|nr:aminoacyl-histidine dipeptidase [Clostridia bacterium]